MSPHAVNNFVSDLVLMAQAMEELPKVKHDLEEVGHLLEEERNTVKDRDSLLEQSRQYAASLEQKVRELEVAKDSAETMFLEADERTSRALDFIKATFGNAGTLIQALEPPKPEPVVEKKPEPMPMALPSGGWHNDEIITPAQGQSEPDPTVPVTQIPQVSNAHDMSQETVVANIEAPSWATPSPQPDTPPAPSQPYAGKNYIDVKGWVSREDWLAGGGTNETYDYRHSQLSF